MTAIPPIITPPTPTPIKDTVWAVVGRDFPLREAIKYFFALLGLVLGACYWVITRDNNNVVSQVQVTMLSDRMGKLETKFDSYGNKQDAQALLLNSVVKDVAVQNDKLTNQASIMTDLQKTLQSIQEDMHNLRRTGK